MPLGDPYVTSPQLKKSISLEGIDAADDDVDSAVRAASRAIENVTRRRTFWKAEGSAPRTYTATSDQLVVIDDLVSLDSVTSDGTAVTVLPEPLNAEADLKPYTRLTLTSGSLSTTPGAVEVTGTWGWPDVPDEVKQMTTILASKLLKRTREATFGVVSVGGMDGDAIRLAKEDPDLQLLITPLRRHFPAVA